MKYLIILLLMCGQALASHEKPHGETTYRPGGGGGGGRPTPQHPGGGGSGGSLGGGGGHQPTADQRKRWDDWHRQQREAQARAQFEAERQRIQNSRNDFQKKVAEERKQNLIPTSNLFNQASQLSQFFTREGYHLQRDILKEARNIQQNLLNEPIAQPELGDMLLTYSKDLLQASADFLRGVQDGTIRGFQDQAISAVQVAQAIYENPMVLTHIGEGVTRILSHPERFTAYAKEAYQHYKQVMIYGTPYDVGRAAGHLAADVLSGIAVHEVAAVKYAVQQMRWYAVNQWGEGANLLGRRIAYGIEMEGGYKGQEAGRIFSETVGLDAQTKGALRGWSQKFDFSRVESAESMNARLLDGHPTWSPPYTPGTQVSHFVTNDTVHFVRVHGTHNRIDNFMMRAEDIQGLTPKEIQVKYSLPAEPTHVSDVFVPPRIPMTRGQVNDIVEVFLPGQNLHTPPGVMQYHLETPIPPESFKNTRPL